MKQGLRPAWLPRVERPWVAALLQAARNKRYSVARRSPN